MNKKIIIISIALSFLSIIHASEGQQKRKVTSPKMIIAEIPPFSPKKTISDESSSTSCLTTTTSSPMPTIHPLPFSIATTPTLLDLCKANDTQELAIACKQFPLYDPAYNMQDKYGNTPLHIACKKNNLDMVRILLHRTDNINIQNNNKETPLHVACRNKNENNTEIVKLLCRESHRINPLLRDNVGSTALHIVCMSKNITLTEMVLNAIPAIFYFSREALISIGNDERSTALNIACMFKNIQIAELLLKQHFINPNLPQEDGSTPLHNAVMVRCYPIIELLLKHSRTNPNQQDTVLIVKYRKAKRKNPEDNQYYICDEDYAKERRHNTPLHLACYQNDAKAVKLLLQHPHIKHFMRNCDGLMPYDIALQNNNQEIIALFPNS